MRIAIILCGLLIMASRSLAQPAPLDCAGSAEHRQFDFWLGEWLVADAKGTPQGLNRITMAENGCLLVEQWTSATGGTGQSMNYYDPGGGTVAPALGRCGRQHHRHPRWP